MTTSFAPQGSAEWLAEREGKLTASTFGPASGIGPSSRQELWRRHMGLSTFEGNPATDYGTEHEPDAVREYAEVTGCDVKPAGFMVHREFDWLGASPDGLISDSGCIEVKCPYSGIVYPAIPPYYMAQMQGVMEVTGREWCDFVVWTPEVLSVQRVHRSSEYWLWMLMQLADFWTYVESCVEPPRAKRKPVPPDCVKVGGAILINLS